MARTDDTGDKTTFQVALIRPLAGFCGGLAVLTIVSPDWIEALTAYDPDQHAGSVKWSSWWRACQLGRPGSRGARRMAPIAARDCQVWIDASPRSERYNTQVLIALAVCRRLRLRKLGVQHPRRGAEFASS
jgi:hypothetical protein